MTTSTIGTTKFRNKSLQIFNDISHLRKMWIITKRGKPIAKVTPIENKPQKLFGCMKGTIKINGDIIKPLNIKWNADE